MRAGKIFLPTCRVQEVLCEECRKKQDFLLHPSTAFALENDYNVPQMKTQEVEKSQERWCTEFT